MWNYSLGYKISQTSMAWTAFRPWKFIQDIGSSSHWLLIMAPGQETNSVKLEIFLFATQ